MIEKVTRGWRIGGLIRYLMGPTVGPARHTDQHVIASWDGSPEAHQPPRVAVPDGGIEFDVSKLIAELSEPAFAGGKAFRKPAPGKNGRVPQGLVWQCSLRNRVEDRVLSDEEWARVAADVMDATGIARRGDPDGCRWVAIRHADDHVHIAAVLVRKESYRRVYPHRDWGKDSKTRKVVQAAEVRLGITRTEDVDRTAVGQATRAEMEKAARRGCAEPPRAWLRRAARVAAVAARDTDSFEAAVSDLGVRIAWREERGTGRRLGYRLAAPGDVNADGMPIWFSGSTLAKDLSLVKLAARWADRPAPAAAQGDQRKLARDEAKAEAENLAQTAVEVIERARQSVAASVHAGIRPTPVPRGGHGGGRESAAGIAHATQDMLIAVCDITRPVATDRTPRGGPADVYQRASAQAGVGQPTRWGPIASELRTVAHQMMRLRGAGGRLTTVGSGAALIAAIAALIAEIGAYHETRRCLAQARAARHSAGQLNERRAPTRPPRRDSGRTRPEPARRLAQRRATGAPPPRTVQPPGTGQSPGQRR